MRMNLRGILLFFFQFTLTLAPLSLFGRHIIGGEITYKYLSTTGTSNRYEITMKIYRDCLGGGAGFDNPAIVAIYKGSMTNNSFVTKLLFGNPTTKPLVAVPPPCVSSLPNVCVEEAVYTKIIDLPILDDQSYFIVYQRCCRNQTISNIISPGDIGATYTIELTADAQKLQNSSLTFNNFPPIIICNNIPFEFDHSATDIDGDQIFYSLCSPLDGGGRN